MKTGAHYGALLDTAHESLPERLEGVVWTTSARSHMPMQVAMESALALVLRRALARELERADYKKEARQ